MLEKYLEAAVEMGFKGTSIIEDGILYLFGDACRLLYEEIPAKAWKGKQVDGRDVVDINDVHWDTLDLEESVPAKIVVTEKNELLMLGPVGCGLAGGDWDDELLDDIQMEGLEDFRRLFPLVIDVLAGEFPEVELKEKTVKLSNLIRETKVRNGVSVVATGTGG